MRLIPCGKTVARIYQQGGQKPGGGAKNQKGGHIFEIQYWMYAATRGPNVKWRGTDFKWGLGTTGPPAGDGPTLWT